LKQHLSQLVGAAITGLQAQGVVPADARITIQVDRARDTQHGDFACNAAMMLAKQAGMKPRDLAQLLVDAMPASELTARVEIAGPGFINFYLHPHAFNKVVHEILDESSQYGRLDTGGGKRVQIEFVSANPTGPLHVGHGRGAAYGAALGNLLEAAGFDVQREYYVNDAGRQMDILAASVWLRYLDLCGEAIDFPARGYQGDYVWDIAATLHREGGEAWRHPFADIAAGAPDDEEQLLDHLVERASGLLGPQGYEAVFRAGLDAILEDIRRDLREFGVEFDNWYSERSLTGSGAVERAIEALRAGGHLYEKSGALWFRSSELGDEKDRVVVRENGQATYFASDIAYHLDKYERGFERIIDIWGADHHGYVPRTRAAMRALGKDPDTMEVMLVQFAVLYRGGEKLQMSTRSGEFVTLRELRHEVGNDAARFFYILRKCEQHLDFDLDLAKSHSNDNPVYYVQYAHARICSVFRQLEEKGMTYDAGHGMDSLDRLAEPHERQLLVALSRYPEIVESAALCHEPHQLAYFLRDLANEFHTYYNAHQFLVEDAALRNARLALISAAAAVIRLGLGLLGVSAPEQM